MNVIITGSTGMVGKSVLLECLENHKIENILIINRSKLGVNHPKLKEVLLQDFSKLDEIKLHLLDYDACFHCMGVSVIGMNEENYTNIIFNYTKILADMLYEINPQMVFNYVSGTATDSSEKGRVMWARVKGKAENYVFNKGFSDAYAFRPGAIIPEKGIKSRTVYYNIFYALTKPIHPILKRLSSIITTTHLGKAMVNSVLFPQPLKILENKHIKQLAAKQ